jgi:excisionase family DNA binding protein
MKPEFERILEEPTTSVIEAGLVLGLARNTAYEAVRRGELPVLRFGNRMRVPTIILRKMIEGNYGICNREGARGLTLTR